MKHRRLLLVAAAICGLGALSQVPSLESRGPAAEVEWVVGRGETSIELFLSADTADLIEAFGSLPQPFADPSGMVEVETFRNGTTELGEWLSTQWDATIDGQPFEIEPMTAMLHPVDDPMPFRTLFEAFMAISVCNVPLDQKQIHVDDTRMYASFIFYPVDGLTADLVLDLNSDLLDGASMSVRQVTDWDTRVRPDAPVLQNGTLTLPAEAVGGQRRWGAAVLGVLAAAFAFLAIAKGRANRTPRFQSQTTG